jgi:hypothetical protein
MREILDRLKREMELQVQLSRVNVQEARELRVRARTAIEKARAARVGEASPRQASQPFGHPLPHVSGHALRT